MRLWAKRSQAYQISWKRLINKSFYSFPLVVGCVRSSVNRLVAILANKKAVMPTLSLSRSLSRSFFPPLFISLYPPISLLFVSLRVRDTKAHLFPSSGITNVLSVYGFKLLVSVLWSRSMYTRLFVCLICHTRMNRPGGWLHCSRWCYTEKSSGIHQCLSVLEDVMDKGKVSRYLKINHNANLYLDAVGRICNVFEFVLTEHLE